MNMEAPKEQRNKFGVETKPLYYRHLEYEYWALIREIMEKQEKKHFADAIRWALKKSTGRI